MEEKLKEIMDLHKRFSESIGRKEKNVPLAIEVLQKEADAFNGLYFCGNTLRCNMVAALMERYIETLKKQGIYDEGLVTNTKELMATAYMCGGQAKGE